MFAALYRLLGAIKASYTENISLVGLQLSIYTLNHRSLKKRTLINTKHVRQPGIEPGSTAWKATMLTVTPPTLVLVVKRV